MIEALKDEVIVDMVGGKFRLSTLIQKRLVALNGGSRALVEIGDPDDKMEVVIQEILQGKIFLDTSNEVLITGEVSGETNEEMVDLTDL